jgi:hypothetical protein
MFAKKKTQVFLMECAVMKFAREAVSSAKLICAMVM